MSLKRVIASLSFLFFTINIIAQKTPMKFGDIPKEDLKMTSYEADPDAAAVVLGDFGRISFLYKGNSMAYEFKYHKRIKILKESAFDQGEISIDYYKSQNTEKVNRIKARVYYPDGTKQELSKKDVFDKKVNEYWSQKKFAIPNLKEGCIIEYQYTKISEQIFTLEDWAFQEDIPTRLSELWLDSPDFYVYVYLMESGQGPIETQTIEGGGNSGASARFRTNRTIFRKTNVEAMKEEPFITTMNDYRSNIRFQLKEVLDRGIKKEILSTWPKLAKRLSEMSDFGHRFAKPSRTPKLIRAAKPFIDASATPLEKIKAMQAFISREVKWNEKYGKYANEPLDVIFEKKIADGGEINMMLLALLKSEGIEAYPALISTRSSGKVTQIYPIVDQFNHLIVYTEVDGKPMFLDALDEYHPVGYPHRNSLNHFAWVVDKKNPKWVNMIPSSSSASCLATFDLDSKGVLNGTISASLKGYKGAYEREEFATNNYGSWKKELEETFPDTKIDSIEKINLDNIYEPLKVNIACTVPAAQINGDFIYLSPMVLPAFSENPFKLESRNYPVEIAYPIKENYVLNLKLPDGYVLEELPEEVKLSLPNKGGSFQYRVRKIDDQNVQLISKVSIKQLYFSPEDYLAIKQFVDMIVEKQGEQIVLKKKS